MDNHAGSALAACLSMAAMIAVFLTAGAVCRAATGDAAPKAMRVYVGTYTNDKSQSKGIYQMRLDLAAGTLGKPELAVETPNASFLAIHPSRKFLYSANEVWGGAPAVTAFAIATDTGALTLLNKQAPGGGGPCYVSLDKDGRVAMVANYGTGTVASYPIGADGKLGEAATVIQHFGKGANPKRQEGPHAHCIDPDPAARFALACDLGLDKVLVCKLDAAKATLTLNDTTSASVAAGAGPRHLSFAPSGKFVYVISEMGNTVTAFSYDAAQGGLKEIQAISTLPADFKGESYCAEIEVHPSGRFLYGTNRGHDSIAIFAVDAEKGTLKPLGHEPTQGKNPRHFGIDPTGTLLLAANQDSNNVVVFRIDPKTGGLTPTGATAKIGAPVCLKFIPMP